jgi:hypothetical protein
LILPHLLFREASLTVSTPFIGTVDFESLSGIDTKWVALLGGGARAVLFSKMTRAGKQ